MTEIVLAGTDTGYVGDDSVIEICNLALLKIGNADNYITNLDPPDNTKEARALNLVYNHAVDVALAAYPWNCATKIAKLVAISPAPTVTFGWEYSFLLPGDCVFLQAVSDTEDGLDPDSVYSADFRRYQQYILTNDAYYDTATTAYWCWVKYTSNTVYPAYYDSRLREALVLVLASYIAESLTGNRQLKGDIWNEYLKMIEEMHLIDAIEGQENYAKSSSSFVTERG